MWFTCAELIHSLLEYLPGDWLTALRLSEYASYNVPDCLSAGPPVHQFWWLVPLNNHPVQADKRVITRSTCGWIVEEKEGELSRAGQLSLSRALTTLQQRLCNSLAVERSRSSSRWEQKFQLAAFIWVEEEQVEREKIMGKVFFGALYIIWKRLQMNDHFLWLFIHSTLNLPLSRFLELVLLYFCLSGGEVLLSLWGGEGWWKLRDWNCGNVLNFRHSLHSAQDCHWGRGRKDLSRDFSSVGSESSHSGGGEWKCENLGSSTGGGGGRRRCCAGGISGWLDPGVGVREEIGATPNLSPIPLLIHSPFNFSSKFRKSQKMPLNIPTKEK